MSIRARKVKVVYVLAEPELSGGVRVVFQHAELLRKAGYRVVVAASGSRPSWSAFRGEYRDYTRTSLTLGSDDLIIATYWTTIPFLQSLGVNPSAHFCQGYEGHLSHLAHQRGAIEEVYRQSIPTLVIAPHLGELLASRFDRRWRLVSPIIGPPFRPSMRWPSPSTNPWIAVPGIFEAEVKGVPNALRAVTLIRERGQHCRVLRVSILPLSPEERRMFEPDRYLYRADPRDVADALRRCDLLLFPSLASEGLGLPALEAMVSKVPVIASAIPATQYSGVPVRVPVGDSEAFATESLRLLRDRAHWRQVRELGYTAARQFSAECARRQLVDAIEWICANRS